MNLALAFLAEHRQRLDLARQGIPERLTSLVLTPRFQASRHVVFLLMPAGTPSPLLVAKVPRLVDTNASLAREAASLEAVQALAPGGFDSIPRVIAFEPYRGRALLIETALAGSAMAPDVVRRNPDHCCQLVSDWLLALHSASARESADWFARLVDEPLQWMEGHLSLTDGDAALIEGTRRLVEPLREATLPFVYEHGDLSHPNLFVTSPTAVGVVDWELAQRDGLVVYDLFVFLAYVAFSRHRAHDTAAQIPAFRDAFFQRGSWASRAVRQYAERAGIPVALLTPLFALTWARYTITLLFRLAEANPEAPGVVTAADATWLRTNRFYLLWREALDGASAIDWSA